MNFSKNGDMYLNANVSTVVAVLEGLLSAQLLFANDYVHHDSAPLSEGELDP